MKLLFSGLALAFALGACSSPRGISAPGITLNDSVQQAAPQLEQFVNQFLVAFVKSAGSAATRLEPLAAGNCVSFGGDTTDRDGDGYPKNVTITYTNCETPGLYTKTLTSGTLFWADRNDDLKDSGFSLTGDFDARQVGNDPQTPVEGVDDATRLSMTVIPLAAKSTSISYSVKSVRTHQGSAVMLGSTSETRSLEVEATFTPDPDARGRRLNMEGGSAYEATTRDPRVGTLRSATRFSADLHISDGKNNCTGIDSGSVTFEAGGFAQTVRYGPCNQRL